MENFYYKNNQLHTEQLSLTSIARQYGTPCYVYSRAAIESAWRDFDAAFDQYPHRICYAVKANSNIAILQLLANLGSGFDIVSQGELERVLTAGGEPNKIVFSGVGKSTQEILRALEVGIYSFNVESIPELERIHAVAAQQNTIASIALRINPNIDAKTHPYIATGLSENKFGIELNEIPNLCEKLKSMPHIQLKGFACHIGSQLTDLEPFHDAVTCLLTLIDELKIKLDYINLGGGLGILYQDESPPAVRQYVSQFVARVKPYNLEIILEPGRAIVGNAGALITTIEYIKPTPHKSFAIVDAGMNDLIRPALYEAWQQILPVVKHEKTDIHYDVVGPVCESADFLGKNRSLAIQPGDLLAVLSAGAYGFSMSSNYNSRPRIAEILVDGAQHHLIRRRETIQDLFAQEQLIP